MLSDPFQKDIYRNNTYSVQILEKLEGNGGTARNALGASIKSTRKQCKKTWMLKLRNIYQDGLNDRLGDKY